MRTRIFRTPAFRDLMLGLAALAAMTALLVSTAYAGGPISSASFGTAESGIKSKLLSTSPNTEELPVAGYNHVVFSIPMAELGTSTVLGMRCVQSPDGIIWSPIPACESTNTYTLTCGKRLWRWPASEGPDATFFVPVNAAKLRCSFFGDDAGGTRFSVHGYRANL